MSTSNISYGYQFCPTDQQIVSSFLLNKVRRLGLPCDCAVKEADVYGVSDPSELFVGTKEKVVYYFTQLKRKSKTDKRFTRTIAGAVGTWKGQTGGERVHDSKGRWIGSKKSFTYMKDTKKGGYNMTEFSLDGGYLCFDNVNNYVLCYIKRKSTKNLEDKKKLIIPEREVFVPIDGYDDLGPNFVTAMDDELQHGSTDTEANEEEEAIKMSTSNNIPHGYNFHPTNLQIISGYLLSKVRGLGLPCDCPVKEADVYGVTEPSELFVGTEENIVYYFTKLKRKSKTGKRFARTTTRAIGTWKGQTGGKPVHDSKGRLIGSKKSFTYMKDKKKGGYNMNEFSLDGGYLCFDNADNYVLCCIKRKPTKILAEPIDDDDGMSNVEDGCQRISHQKENLQTSDQNANNYVLCCIKGKPTESLEERKNLIQPEREVFVPIDGYGALGPNVTAMDDGMSSCGGIEELQHGPRDNEANVEEEPIPDQYPVVEDVWEMIDFENMLTDDEWKILNEELECGGIEELQCGSRDTHEVNEANVEEEPIPQYTMVEDGCQQISQQKENLLTSDQNANNYVLCCINGKPTKSLEERKNLIQPEREVFVPVDGYGALGPNVTAMDDGMSSCGGIEELQHGPRDNEANVEEEPIPDQYPVVEDVWKMIDFENMLTDDEWKIISEELERGGIEEQQCGSRDTHEVNDANVEEDPIPQYPMVEDGCQLSFENLPTDDAFEKLEESWLKLHEDGLGHLVKL